jgi:hypothetical protein
MEGVKFRFSLLVALFTQASFGKVRSQESGARSQKEYENFSQGRVNEKREARS